MSKAARKTNRPEVLWCSNQRTGNGNSWSFPPNVRKHLQLATEGKRVLHLFGGRSTFGTRLDIDPIVRPDVIGDAWLPPFRQDSFDIVILDPPYIRFNAQERTALFRAAAWLATEYVIWFHTMWVAAVGGVASDRSFLVRVGDNCQVRCLQYFRVLRPKRGPVAHFSRGPAMKYNRWLAQPNALPFIYD